MNKPDVNDLIKEIDKVKTYLEFFKEEVMSTRCFGDVKTNVRMAHRIYKAIKYIVTGKFEVEIVCS